MCLGRTTGGDLGWQSVRLALIAKRESTVLEDRGMLTSYREQLDRLQTQIEGSRASTGSGPTGVSDDARLLFASVGGVRTLGVVPPSRLIPIAEECQMIISLGTCVLREACRQNRRWQLDGYPPVRVAVNTSSMRFAREDFADSVAKVLEEPGLAPEFLELELTESVVVKDYRIYPSVAAAEAAWREYWIDDFGTEYSSLNYLHQLPIDRLKIDRSFIQMLNAPNSTLPILEAIISMAKNMELGVVREGVETDEHMAMLCLKGCDLLQGFLYSRPVSADRAKFLLQAGAFV